MKKGKSFNNNYDKSIIKKFSVIKLCRYFFLNFKNNENNKEKI